MPRIQKVLNSSVVLVDDPVQGECIILDKGIGYGRKPGEEAVPTREARIFKPTQKGEMDKLIELLDSIDSSYLEATSLIVEYASAVLGAPLDEHVYVALTDHLHFATIRQQRGLILTNRIYWEIKSFYPREFRIGEYGLKVMKSVCGIELDAKEAANIAFHIINAEKGSDDQYHTGQATRMLEQILQIVNYSLVETPDENSMAYSRFLTHVQFFVQRVFDKSMLSDEDLELYQKTSSQYPDSMNVAEKVRQFLEKQYHQLIPDEETAYLAIHIHRLMKKKY